MNLIFVILSILAIVLAVILYIIYRKKLNESCHTASVAMILVALLFVFCRFLDFESLNNPQSTEYLQVTTYTSDVEYQSGRPTMKQTTTVASTHVNREMVVYITKKGTKYHYSYDCGKNEYYQCTIEQALNRGLEPCKKCVD